MNKLQSKRAAIVGAGIAGIATALRLRKQGFEVSVYEKNAYLGGKLTEIYLNGYRFDAGPSLFTLPNLLTELFELFTRNPSDYFQYTTLSTATHYFFEDGTFLPFPTDKTALLKEVEARLKTDSKELASFLERSKLIHEKTTKVFLEQSLHKFSSYLSKDIVKCVLAIPKLGLFTDLDKMNKRFVTHPKLQQIFNRFATYNGSNPYVAPGILSVIPHLELGIGTYFPKEGMHSIPQSLIRLAKEEGVEFHTNTEVQKINVSNTQIQGIRVNDQDKVFDLVVCNSDVKFAYKHLLSEIKKPKKTLQQEPSSSAYIFYWGIKKQFDQLDVHNIFFSDDYKTEFDHIFNKKVISDDPTIYIHISSKINKTDAPLHGENWFVMVNVPHNQGQDWQEEGKRIRSLVLSKLNRMMGEDIEELIEAEDFLDPKRIEERTCSVHGSLYGTSSNDRMAAFFRHPNFSKIKGLYFVGGSVHPGGGIPLCLLSAKIASNIVKADYKT